MNILVTGSAGFVGKNLVENLKNIRDGKNRTHPELNIDEIYEFDRSNTLDELDAYCQKCDFVFHLAGIGKQMGLSGVLSVQAVSVHGGWKLPLPPEPKPVLPQFPHKEPVPVP